MPKKKIILLGGGGHCHSCVDVIESDGRFQIAGVVEQPGRSGVGSVLGYPVVGFDNELEALRNQYEYALVTVGQIGSGAVREKLFNNLRELNFFQPVIVSALAHVSKYATIGEGTIVMHHALVNAGVNIGVNCIVNTKCLIEHDSTVGAHTHVSTGVVVNGNATVGSHCFIGSNSTVANGANIHDNYFFKAGSLIINMNDGKPNMVSNNNGI